jgi:D-beta-D-heptose 7-phosphate kinase/D-beta-D-heptose 1-phosphate adenosyltransferase
MIQELLNRNFTLAFTNGCFDFGLTAGHIACLEFAKCQCDRLVVALNTDDSIRRLKGEGRPVLPLEDRMRIVSALRCVDYVVSFDEDTPLEVIKAIRPDVIVKGGEYSPEQVAGYGLAPVKICPMVECLSTTQKLRRNPCEQVTS